MDFTILGSGTGVPRVERASPGYWLRLETGQSVLFDTGPGALRQLAAAGGQPDDVDGLVFSHYHPDHISDLVHFLFVARFHRGGRRCPLWIAGPLGFQDFYDRLLDVHGAFIRPTTFPLEIQEMSSGRRPGPGFTLQAAPTVHMEGSLAFRVDTAGGRSLVYSGDTEYAPSLVELARGAEVLVCECSFSDESPSPGHCTPALVGRMAAEAGVGQVVLTHLYPEADRADVLGELRRAWLGPACVAKDLLRIRMPEGSREVSLV